MDKNGFPPQLQNFLKTYELTLDEEQPHIGGERALLSPGKLVLMAKTQTSLPVVLKYSLTAQGAEEITREAKVRRLFETLPFSEQSFLLPKIVAFGCYEQDTFIVSEFIVQPKVLVDYTLQEQFFMSVQALENQESFHATTNEHGHYVRDYFGTLSPQTYQTTLAEKANAIIALRPELAPLLSQVEVAFVEKQAILNTFSDYLVHADFAPHNFRIVGNQLYLLDYVSFKLANKYEAWARYVNFMELHEPALARTLVAYLEKDRNQFELTSLWLMRLYRVVFLIHYYCSIFDKTTGDLHVLTAARIEFWSEILKAVYNGTAIPEDLIVNYTKVRDSLRTEAEKQRQRTYTKTN